MEIHIELPEDKSQYAPENHLSYQQWFDKAVVFANKFYGHEIQRISSISWEKITADDFFREYIWVVHASGFSAKAVSRFIFPILEAYGPYEQLGGDEKFEALPRVLAVCNNKMKAKAVHSMAGIMHSGINKYGWSKWKDKNIKNVNDLSSFPYIGNVTKYHLGRNIGMLNYVKPDLHLNRLASYWGFSSAEEMISRMSAGYDYPLGVADMIAWYYASSFGTEFAKKAS